MTHQDALMLFLAQVRDDLRRMAEEANRMLNAQVALHQDTAPSDEAASGLSNFIRNASDERKAEVYGRVMDKVAEKQLRTVGAAGPLGACDFPACAVHHICTKPCERNAGVFGRENDHG